MSEQMAEWNKRMDDKTRYNDWFAKHVAKPYNDPNKIGNAQLITDRDNPDPVMNRSLAIDYQFFDKKTDRHELSEIIRSVYYLIPEEKRPELKRIFEQAQNNNRKVQARIFISFDRDGHGELGFGAVKAALALDYARTVVFFTFEGSDEGDPISGSGSAELTKDAALEIELSFHNGDDALLKAKQE